MLYRTQLTESRDAGLDVRAWRKFEAKTPDQAAFLAFTAWQAQHPEGETVWAFVELPDAPRHPTGVPMQVHAYKMVLKVGPEAIAAA